MSTDAAHPTGLLLGNGFPLSLVRRRVVIEPATVENLRAALRGKTLHSFWGHASTLAAASRLVGTDLAPATTRPALVCDAATQFPSLNGRVFSECWIVSPEFAPGFRPAIGEEVPAERIVNWQVLHLQWA